MTKHTNFKNFVIFMLMVSAVLMFGISLWASPFTKVKQKPPILSLHEQACSRANLPKNTTTYEIRTSKEGGIPLDTPILVKGYNADGSNKIIYKLPIGYRTGWGNNQTPSLDSSGLNMYEHPSFTFWMPDKRYPESPMGITIGLQLKPRCEDGRLPPNDEQYIVTFYVGKTTDDPDRRPKEKWGTKKPDVIQFGLYKYALYEDSSSNQASRKPLFTGQKHNSVTYYSEFGDEQVYFYCAGREPRDCRGSIYNPKANFFLDTLFPESQMKNWQEIIKTIKAYVNQWTIEERVNKNFKRTEF